MGGFSAFIILISGNFLGSFTSLFSLLLLIGLQTTFGERMPGNCYLCLGVPSCIVFSVFIIYPRSSSSIMGMVTSDN